MWLLALELRTSGRAASALNHCAISPDPTLEVLAAFILSRSLSGSPCCCEFECVIWYEGQFTVLFPAPGSYIKSSHSALVSDVGSGVGIDLLYGRQLLMKPFQAEEASWVYLLPRCSSVLGIFTYLL